MIITKLSGGLGNQMFQYAVGRTLAYLNKTFVKIDTSSFQEDKLRNFDLLCFNADISVATQQEIANLLPSHNFEKLFQYLSPRQKRTYYREKKFSFDRSVLDLGANVYLNGYFQSEKYFLPAQKIIRNDFTFRKEMIKNVEPFSASLKPVTAVSVHIRRGDMSKNPSTADYHGTVSLEYYNAALELMRTRLSSPVFYIFSDDISWAKENLKAGNAVYVSGSIAKTHIEDLYLMSKCRHNIIANSSFSWWGAWLNDNPDKIVVAPKNWFNKGPKDTQDLVPASWIKI